MKTEKKSKKEGKKEIGIGHDSNPAPLARCVSTLPYSTKADMG